MQKLKSTLFCGIVSGRALSATGHPNHYIVVGKPLSNVPFAIVIK